jgi:hypothetical protein
MAKPKKEGGFLPDIFNSGVKIGELNKKYELDVMIKKNIVSDNIKSFLRKILVTNEEIKKNKEKLKEELTNFYDKKVLNAQILYLLSNKLERLINSIFKKGYIFKKGDIEYNKELQNIKKELDDGILSATNDDLDLDISPNKNKLYNYHFKTNITYFIDVLGVDNIIATLNIGEKVAEHIKKSNDDDDYMTKLFYLFEYYINKEDFKINTIENIILIMINNILNKIEEIYKKPFMSDYNNYINKLEAKKMNVSDEDVINEVLSDEVVSDEDVMSGRGGAKKKKGSKVVTKRVPTPYNKFVKKHFPELKKKFPNDKAPEIMKKIAIEWKKTKK